MVVGNRRYLFWIKKIHVARLFQYTLFVYQIIYADYLVGDKQNQKRIQFSGLSTTAVCLINFILTRLWPAIGSIEIKGLII